MISPWAQDTCVIIAALASGIGVVISALNARSIKANTETTKATHALVNSDHGIDLRLVATVLKRIATLTGHSEDESAAKFAKLAADNHDLTQAQINKGNLETPTQKWTKLP